MTKQHPRVINPFIRIQNISMHKLILSPQLAEANGTLQPAAWWRMAVSGSAVAASTNARSEALSGVSCMAAPTDPTADL